MKIYKHIKLFPLLFLLMLLTLNSNISIAAVSGRLEYNSVLFDYSKLNFSSIKKEADKNFDLYLQTKNRTEKKKFLNLATSKYYILTKIDYTRIEPYIQLGRIYDYTDHPRLAKEYFSKAINIEPDNPSANFYFGEFYYTRRDYNRALKYYRIAYNNGYSNKYDINIRLATINEKLADLINAKKFYEISYSIKPDNKIQEKIQLLNELNYDKSEYYHIIRE